MPATASAVTGETWTLRPSAADNEWIGVTYGNGLFVAVSQTGSGNRVMTSPDAITWTVRLSPQNNTAWRAVTYGDGRFVAVGNSGTGDRVMTSEDGITWTTRTSPVDQPWEGVAYANGRFVAVGSNAAALSDDRVMTSPDGLTWTIRQAAARVYWRAVTHAGGQFVAVGGQGSGITSRVRAMTSQDGVTWTTGPEPNPAPGNFYDVAFGNGAYVAVGSGGANGAAIMTSPDGTTWTDRTSPVGTTTQQWRGVAFGNGRFVVVGQRETGVTSSIITSTDGINWTAQATPAFNQWYGLTYANDMFVSVAQSGTGNRVMTSGVLAPAVPATPVASAGDARATVTVSPGMLGLGTGGAATRFTVTASPGGATCAVQASVGGACEVTGLANGTPYTFTATATNGAGTSTASGASAAVTPVGPVQPVARLAGRTTCLLGRCITAGIAPAGTTRVLQVARRATPASRVTGRCTLKARRANGSRPYTCTVRLGRGMWTLATQARTGTTVTARSSTRVRVTRTARPVVTG